MTLLKTIIYVYPKKYSFINEDIQGLKKHYNVIENSYNWRKKIFVPFFMIHQFFSIILNRKVKTIFVSFGGYWAFAPSLIGKLTGKSVYIILHGTDCASIEALNYGSFRKPIQKLILKWSYKMATKLLPVSQSLIKHTNNFDPKVGEFKLGVKHFLPNLNTNIEVVPNGFDYEFWKSDNTSKHQKLFLAVFSEAQFYLKGGDLIEELALKKPSWNFEIAGCSPNGKKSLPNLKYLGYLNKEKLRAKYSEVQFYFQLSSFEGFGCSLAEAMLCGCIPIVSNVNNLPDISGEIGIVIAEKKIETLENSITALLEQDLTNLSLKSRFHIIENYPLYNRIEKLKELINN
jgi:glycosyltransferase involved in cell wall biosynthesis